MVFSDFVDGFDVCEEDCAAAVLLYSEVVEDFSFVFSVLDSFLVFLPFVAYDFATAWTSYGELHFIRPLTVGFLLFVSSTFARL